MSTPPASPAARCGAWHGLARRGPRRAWHNEKPPGGAGRRAVPEDGLSEIRASPPRGGEPGVSGGSQYLRTRAAGTGEAAGAGEYSGTMNRIQPSVE